MKGPFAGYRDKNVWWRTCTWPIAMAIDFQDDSGGLRIVFHGAWHDLLHRVFASLRGQLFKDYKLIPDNHERIINGKCDYGLAVNIIEPNYHVMSVSEWPVIIIHRMEHQAKCKVTYYKDFNKFLNN